jgi:hypothetical protein
MDATIIYLKDGKNGTIEASMEIIGDPLQSFTVGTAAMESIALLQQTRFVDNEFTQMPPTDLMQ